MGYVGLRYSLAAILLSGCAHVAPLTPVQQETLADATELCALVREEYIYFAERKTGWDAACDNPSAMIAPVTDRAEQLRALETLADVLHDPHISFGTNSALSPRLVPSGSDYWLDGPRVVAVRQGSAAAKADLRIGDIVVAVNGMALEDALRARLQPAGVLYSAEQESWALNAAVAGHWNVPRSVTVSRTDGLETLSLASEASGEEIAPLSATLIDGSIGYIRFHDSLGDSDTVAAFDAVMNTLKDARFWIIDLRDTPGGGSTDVAEPILGRFLAEPAEYQRIRPADAPEWTKISEPYGDWTAEGPVAVLVGRWTGSMGEGLAIGFDGTGRGEVFGSDMARLAGGVDEFKLSQTGFSIRIPTYDLAHMNGTPRHEWSPPYPVLADNGGGPDLALQAARDWFASFEQ